MVITAIIFSVSLICLVLFLLFKEWELRSGQNFSLFGRLHWSKFDPHFSHLTSKARSFLSLINWGNICLIFSWIAVKIKKGLISLKRRFDHKQSKFFSGRPSDVLKPKETSSAFLKDISLHKRTLRDRMEEKSEIIED